MKKALKLSLYFASLFAMFSMFNGCKPEPVPEPEPEPEIPASITVTTSSVSNITETSAKCGGEVSATGYTVGECGLCWNTTGNPTIDDDRTTDQIGTGYFVSTISGLKKSTKYYVRAYATNEKGTSYGEQKSFTTLDIPTINGYEYVDLGLPSGLKWATCNVGASSPEDYGDYFAWGETSPKAEYTFENSITYGEQMSDISGNAQYDAATANWGGSWRMPTNDEMQELVDYCEWEWTQVNGVNGSKVIGPNGSCIFLPAAGRRHGSSPSDAGSCGLYWSSTPSDYDDDGYAYYLYFDDGLEHVYSNLRYLGHTVRPITE